MLNMGVIIDETVIAELLDSFDLSLGRRSDMSVHNLVILTAFCTGN